MAFDLRAALSDPGFTPGARHLPELLALLEAASDDEAEVLIRVLSRAGQVALAPAAERLRSPSAPTRVRLTRVISRCSPCPERTTLLLGALQDPDSLVRRWAARGLGKGGQADEAVEAALLAAFEQADPPLRRAIAEALGKVGGAASLALLAGLTDADAELSRLAGQSRLLLARSAERTQPSRILLDAALPHRATLVLLTRAGLSRFAAEELAQLTAATVTSPATVELQHQGSLRALLVARCALDLGIKLSSADQTLATPEAVAELVTQPNVLELLRAWTTGPLRFRLSFSGAGHRRSDIWKTAELVARRDVGLVNDSRDAPWEFVVGQRLDRDGVLLVPRAFDDPRFAYRQADVPAASHPTLAAALARAAGARADDVVWDPFTGSGLELVERALLGPYQKLIGTDRDSRALAAARSNLQGASLARFELGQGDALTYRPAGVTLIISNPPMGRRVARDGSLKELLGAFVAHAQRVLVPGGRLVWLSPLPELTLQKARALGLAVERVTSVDMGGFSAELQIARKPALTR